MLVGAKFGTILNKILPSSLLLILLSFLICFTTRKTYYNILKAKAKEAQLDLKNKEKFLEESINKNKDNQNNFDNNLTNKINNILRRNILNNKSFRHNSI